MNKVLDVCRYVINYSNDKDYGVSNLKLQKLLYFIQAYFLIHSMNFEACFEEKIEAWDFGPVVPDAYHEYKQYGSTDIPPIKTYIDFNEENPWNSTIMEFDDNCISEENKKLIKEVVDKLSRFSATDLVNITHNQAPWKDVYVQYENNEITKEAMRDYFGGRLQ